MSSSVLNSVSSQLSGSGLLAVFFLFFYLFMKLWRNIMMYYWERILQQHMDEGGRNLQEDLIWNNKRMVCGQTTHCMQIVEKYIFRQGRKLMLRLWWNNLNSWIRHYTEAQWRLWKCWQWKYWMVIWSWLYGPWLWGTDKTVKLSARLKATQLKETKVMMKKHHYGGLRSTLKNV
jgi:hypothetical protein